MCVCGVCVVCVCVWYVCVVCVRECVTSCCHNSLFNVLIVICLTGVGGYVASKRFLDEGPAGQLLGASLQSQSQRLGHNDPSSSRCCVWGQAFGHSHIAQIRCECVVVPVGNRCTCST